MSAIIKRILFLGTPEFAIPSLEALIKEGSSIVGVITRPDRPKGRGMKSFPPAIKRLATKHGIPVFQPSKLRDPELLRQLAALKPDLSVVVAYGRILPLELINLPRLGTINVHGSILPKYRGAAPIQWALIRGEKETGVTIMQMDEGLDTGDILLIKGIPVAPDDTAGTLAQKLAGLGAEALILALAKMRQGILSPQKQDNARATLAPPLTKDFGLVDWTKSAREIGCLIRGLDPWPGTYTHLAGKRLRLFRPEIIAAEVRDKPGTVCRTGTDGLLIAAGKNYLLVREVQLEGGKRLPVASFLCGHPIQCGSQLA